MENNGRFRPLRIATLRPGDGLTGNYSGAEVGWEYKFEDKFEYRPGARK
jgi:hypothetical protein